MQSVQKQKTHLSKCQRTFLLLFHYIVGWTIIVYYLQATWSDYDDRQKVLFVIAVVSSWWKTTSVLVKAFHSHDTLLFEQEMNQSFPSKLLHTLALDDINEFVSPNESTRFRSDV